MCASECDHEASTTTRTWPTRGLLYHQEQGEGEGLKSSASIVIFELSKMEFIHVVLPVTHGGHAAECTSLFV